MDLIKETTVLTILLQCVLAYSHPLDYLPLTPNPYDPVSYTPDRGIPTQYSEVDRLDLPRPTYLVTPSWHTISSLNKPDAHKEERKSQSKRPSDEPIHQHIDRDAPLRKPSFLPRVKLEFVGQSGMVPKHKDVKETTAKRPEAPIVIIKPGLHRLKPDVEDKPVAEKYGQTPMFKPENPDMFYGKVLPTAYRYTPPDKPDRPRYMDYSRDKDYGQYEVEDESTPTYKPDYIDSLKPTNFDYSTYNGVFNKDMYRTRFPEIITKTLDNIKTQFFNLQPYNERHVAHKSTNDYLPTQSFGKEDNKVGKEDVKGGKDDDIGGKEDEKVDLPPVPKTMPLLRRIQLALLNTVAGLPGGSTAALDSVRAG